MLITSFVIFLVALGQQVVPAAASFRFTFSQIEQCQPVTISFTGNDGAKAIPSSLLLLPFNSTPVSIPIPNAAANSTGVTITFLPLAAGTQFIASLDDESGDSSARVSDIFRVLPSPTGDNSCLPSQPQTAPQFTMPTSVAQCEAFAVAYSSAAPAVRVFAPNGGSFGLTLTGDSTSTQTAFYSMNVTRGTQVVLMAFPLDAPDTGVTSSLMTVGGDASSNKSCFVFTSKGNNNNKSSSSSSNGPPKVSKAVIIALSVVGGVVSLVTILLIFYIVRERRKRLAARSSFDPDLLEKRGSFEKRGSSSSRIDPGFFPQYIPYDQDYVTNPGYTKQKYSPSMSEFDSPSTISWIAASPPIETGFRSNVVARKGTLISTKTASTINPYDIEQMLEYAAGEEPLPTNRRIATSPVDNVSSLAVPRVLPARGHLRDPSDVPQDPSSMMISTYSNPRLLDEGAVMYDSPKSMSSTPISHASYASTADFEMITRPSIAVLSEPREPGSLPRNPSSRFSDPSILDNGNIGSFPVASDKGKARSDSVISWGNLNATGIAR